MLFFSGNDLKVLEVAAQREYKNPVSGGRSITINIYVADGDGNIYDIEVQCSSGANVHRASFYSSMRCRKADNDPFFIFLKKTLAFPKYYAIIMLIKKKGHRCAG